MEFKISKKEISEINETPDVKFPKYTSQIINCANQNAQATRAKMVGQLSDLFPQYLDLCDEISIKSWEKWYEEGHPDSIKNATDKIMLQLENLNSAIKLIDRNLVESWVRDLVINKTYNGLYVQKAILKKLAENNKTTYRLACPSEESKGIDGFVGDVPYSVKPTTYKQMGRLSESIDVKMIYYNKTKTNIKFEIED